MKIYEIYIDDKIQPLVKCKSKRLMRMYLDERNILDKITKARKIKSTGIERFDDNYLVEYYGHSLTNREVAYVESSLEELDAYAMSLSELKKSRSSELKKKELKFVKKINDKLEYNGSVRKKYVESYISNLIKNPYIVEEHFSNMDRYNMFMKED